jgi:predicted metal-binding protein
MREDWNTHCVSVCVCKFCGVNEERDNGEFGGAMNRLAHKLSAHARENGLGSHTCVGGLD